MRAITIIGAGRIGGALAAASAAAGEPSVLIRREEGWEALGEGELGSPILVAVRNDDLDGVLARIPAARRGDLVFVQNGMLRPWLAAHDLEGATRGLLFFAVARRGDRPQPGAPSPFVGPHAPELVAWLGRLGLPAEVVEAGEFAAIELEKLIWNSAFGLLCEAHDASVGEVLDRHADELAALVDEMASVGAAALGVDLAREPLLARLSAYSRSIAEYRGAVKEWPWRNGWFVEAARARGIPTPTHDRLLAAVGRG